MLVNAIVLALRHSREDRLRSYGEALVSMADRLKLLQRISYKQDVAIIAALDLSP